MSELTSRAASERQKTLDDLADLIQEIVGHGVDGRTPTWVFKSMALKILDFLESPDTSRGGHMKAQKESQPGRENHHSTS